MGDQENRHHRADHEGWHVHAASPDHQFFLTFDCSLLTIKLGFLASPLAQGV